MWMGEGICDCGVQVPEIKCEVRWVLFRVGNMIASTLIHTHTHKT